MKIFLILSMTFGAGSYLAAESTDIDETITETAHSFINRVKQRHPKISLDSIRENGFPYPDNVYLESLTDEQVTTLVAYIDQVNVYYDFTNMSDDEIKDALFVIRADLKDLSLELSLPNYHEFMMDEKIVEYIRENGFTLPTDRLYSRLDEDQKLLVDNFINEINQNYDIPNMSDDEILEAFDTVKEDFRSLLDTMEIDFNHSPMKDRIKQKAIDYILTNNVFALPEKFINTLSDEQQVAINDFVEEVNTTFDFANMSDEEISETLKVIHEDLKELISEQDITLPHYHQHRRK